jgi:hypothetical protein
MSRPGSKGLALIALSIVVAVSAVALAAAKPAARTYVASDCNNAAFKPRSIILACGDAGLLDTKLQWTQWGAKKAHGAGLGMEKVCKPNCAAGKFAKGAMKLVLSKPHLCPQDEKRHFTTVHYKWIPAAPGEGRNQGTIPLPCSLLSG